MPLIPYPDVPSYPGVPLVPRKGPGSPYIYVDMKNPEKTVQVNTDDTKWGIYTPDNQPIYEPTLGGSLSFVSLGYTRSMQVSDFPVEANSSNQGAAFASYNKVFQPSNPVVTLSFSGTESESVAFLAAIDSACESTDLFNIWTPDAIYSAPNGYCTVERYSYQRTATRGATMLIVEVSLKQILQVTASLSNVSLAANTISSPQSPSAKSSVSNGNTQALTIPQPSSLLSEIVGVH